MAIKPIGLSFKDTPEDLELYEWIRKHSGQSAFIKDVLKKEMLLEKKKETPKSKTSLIDLNL